MKKLKFKAVKSEAPLFKLDLGCGKGANTPEGFVGVDLPKVDLRKRWPWKNDSVDEAQANYVIHYLTLEERTHFFNELFRVLKKDCRAVIIAPHWCSARAYGDPLIKSIVSEAYFPQLDKGWRGAQNCEDKTGLKCDFAHTVGYGMHPAIVPRNTQYQQDAMMWWKESIQDLYATLTKR